MGAQAAALLAAGGPVGDVPAPFPPEGELRLAPPTPYDLALVARSHGGVGLAPTAWDGEALRLRLPGPVHVAQPDGEDLVITWAGPQPDEAVLRRVLALDDDLGPLHDACDAVPSLAWVRPAGAGRLLRSPTVWQDLVGALASTNASYAATRSMLRALVAGGPFPTPEQVLRRAELPAWGYREASLRELAAAVAEGRVDPEAWLAPGVAPARSSGPSGRPGAPLQTGLLDGLLPGLLDELDGTGPLPDEEVAWQVGALRGFGPFAVASVLPLLGRPRPLLLDGWLRRQVPDPGRFAPMGRWAGSGLWLEVTGRWLRPRR